jgi:hypothetical protein
MMQTRRLLLVVSLAVLCLSAVPARAELWLRFQVDETAMAYAAATQAATITEIADSVLKGSLFDSAVKVDSALLNDAASFDFPMSLDFAQLGADGAGNTLTLNNWDSWDAGDLVSLHFVTAGMNLDTFFGDSRAAGGAVDLSVVPVPTTVLLGILGLGVAGVKLRKYA